ncbi:GNAT family N-acetyltransferase [Pinibacter soli]|uniref:GNAT family N-acetyltransferase n=1 Tax=Pinibacter soli TaxID=3044211 RepID=A0ABT6RF91_9BACT|nr:GNAT family N-acetyltransferase [Pinibacter soli]MDI3321236.1 GNAT family N-acetyltransferase [Pinibacter soli]
MTTSLKDGVRIRAVEEKDYGAVVELLAELDYPDNSVASFAKRYASYSEHEGIAFVYEKHDEVIGFIAFARFPLFHCDGFAGRITALCVKQNHRSAGIGRELIQFIEELARNTGCAVLEVTTKLSRLQTHKFYLQNGFMETHKRYNKKSC